MQAAVEAAVGVDPFLKALAGGVVKQEKAQLRPHVSIGHRWFTALSVFVWLLHESRRRRGCARARVGAGFHAPAERSRTSRPCTAAALLRLRHAATAAAPPVVFPA